MDKQLQQMKAEWTSLSANNQLDGARLSPAFFDLSNEGNSKRAVAMIRWVIKDVLKADPHEALNFVGEDFIEKLGLKACYERVIYPSYISKRSNYKYLLSLCFPDEIKEFSKERLWIMEYNNALNIEKTLTKKTFMTVDARDKARYLFNHYLKNHVGEWSKSKEKAYNFFSSSEGKKEIKAAGLDIAQKLLFDSPLDYFHESVGAKDDFYYDFCRFKEIEKEYIKRKEKEECQK